MKVYAVGLYLEQPTKDANELIESKQVKYMLTHYLTSKATAKKISEGFIELMEAGNPQKLVEANRADIDKYASWLDKDMKPGLTSESLYVPGKGLTLIYQGEIKGTIPGDTFAQMYYRYNVGDKADEKIRKGAFGVVKKKTAVSTWPVVLWISALLILAAKCHGPGRINNQAGPWPL